MKWYYCWQHGKPNWMSAQYLDGMDMSTFAISGVKLATIFGHRPCVLGPLVSGCQSVALEKCPTQLMCERTLLSTGEQNKSIECTTIGNKQCIGACVCEQSVHLKPHYLSLFLSPHLSRSFFSFRMENCCLSSGFANLDRNEMNLCIDKKASSYRIKGNASTHDMTCKVESKRMIWWYSWMNEWKTEKEKGNNFGMYSFKNDWQLYMHSVLSLSIRSMGNYIRYV